MTTFKRINGIALSFLLGGAVGSALALLYAPTSGKHLRNDISSKTNGLIKDVGTKAHSSWNDAKDKTGKIISGTKGVISNNVEKIVRNTENLKEAIRSGVNAYNEERSS